MSEIYENNYYEILLRNYLNQFMFILQIEIYNLNEVIRGNADHIIKIKVGLTVHE